MAKGVAKTYRKQYTRNVAKALTLFCGLENAEDTAKAIRERVHSETGLYPVLADDNSYCEHEAALLAQYAGEALV